MLRLVARIWLVVGVGIACFVMLGRARPHPDLFEVIAHDFDYHTHHLFVDANMRLMHTRPDGYKIYNRDYFNGGAAFPMAHHPAPVGGYALEHTNMTHQYNSLFLVRPGQETLLLEDQLALTHFKPQWTDDGAYVTWDAWTFVGSSRHIVRYHVATGQYEYLPGTIYLQCTDDGRYCAAVDYPGPVQPHLYLLDNHSGAVTVIDRGNPVGGVFGWLPAQERLFYSHTDATSGAHTLRIYDPATDTRRTVSTIGEAIPIGSQTGLHSPDNRWIAYQFYGSLLLLDTNDISQFWEVADETSPIAIQRIQWNPSTSELLIQGYNAFMVYDTQSRQITSTVSVAPDRLYHVQWDARNQNVIVVLGEMGQQILASYDPTLPHRATQILAFDSYTIDRVLDIPPGWQPLKP